MRNGSAARAGGGIKCWPHRRMRRWRVLWRFAPVSLRVGFVTWDRLSLDPVEWQMG
jgi:hypothetical protein